VKFALQNGATAMTDAGLMGAGTGSVNFWASRQIAVNQLTSAVTTTVGGVQATGSGAAFWDIGTLAARLEAGIGTRVLSAVDASLAWANPSFLAFGDLDLLGLTNPLASLLPKSLMYGAVAGWTADSSITWGTPIRDPQGTAILWGTSDGDAILWGTSEDNAILWGTAIMTSPDPW
jgi:hypothetical protein